MQMQPLWRNHALFLPRQSVALDQFLRYPSGRLKDLLDAYAYLLEILTAPTVRDKRSEQERWGAQYGGGENGELLRQAWYRRSPEYAAKKAQEDPWMR